MILFACRPGGRFLRFLVRFCHVATVDRIGALAVVTLTVGVVAAPATRPLHSLVVFNCLQWTEIHKNFCEISGSHT